MAESKGLFSRLKQALTKTRDNFSQRVEELISYYREIDDEFFEELTDLLIAADVGVSTSLKIIEELKAKVKAQKIGDPEKVKGLLREIIIELLGDEPVGLDQHSGPQILLVVGVNGVGKTTAIGKLANKYTREGKKVLLAAADTFRAAAAEQLAVWAQRAGVPLIRHQEGADPAAVVYDALEAAKARGTELLIIDTAGRLHNKKNLMEELRKINRVTERGYPEADYTAYLVLDATTGQNAVQQAKVFSEVAKLDGIILTKLDGSARGGVVLAIRSELGLPVCFVGVGEGIDDLQPFDPRGFAEALF
ncbi:signal recognition particle-docking protein FtsY [Clostridium sp. BSD2780061688st1 E8]|uniref:signal recognition particle-docking protein FtsY n=1 Tax=unclassified Clostridium TaxID=2614128 RepID=UPI00110671B1|nr:signal recognition particle-docking protein FtsY [Clostridium sp. BSD2780061688st1 E8]